MALSVLFIVLIIAVRRPAAAPTFIVSALDDGEVIFSVDGVKPGYRFSTTFTHSVQLSDWIEYYEINDDYDFLLYETRFSDFGWGFPSEPDPGAKMEVTEDYVRYYDMQRVMDSFTVAVTTAADKHILNAGDIQVDLIEKAGPGRLLKFSISGQRNK